MKTYLIQPDDTLWSIAQRFGISVKRLAEENYIIYPCQFVVGMKLIIPTKDNAYESIFRNSEQKSYIDTIKNLFGQVGSTTGEVTKFTFPRYDLDVSVDGVAIEADLALTSWVAFKDLENGSMVMGDLVLLENEINSVISSLINSGIEVTALHNHLIHELPRIMYLHIEGKGNPIELANRIFAALSLTKTPIGNKINKQIAQIDWSLIEGILGHTGSHKGKVLQISIPKNQKVSEDGMIIPASMGIAHSVNFQMEGENVASTGDFVLLSNEVNPVIKSFRNNGITVTAVHNHMLYEKPRLFYLHFWAVQKPERIATSLKHTLDLIK